MYSEEKKGQSEWVLHRVPRLAVGPWEEKTLDIYSIRGTGNESWYHWGLVLGVGKKKS